MDKSEPEPTLSDGIRLLEERLRNCEGRLETLWRDVALLDLANQVLAAARGTQALLTSGFNDVAHVSARNAFEAVHGKKLAIDGEYEPKVSVSTRQENGHVEFRIADNGPGIAPDVRNRIFEPFFTTKPPGQGTGLGLSLSHDIVVQGHGGTLTVENEEGEGAAFIVTLPVSNIETASSA